MSTEADTEHESTVDTDPDPDLPDVYEQIQAEPDTEAATAAQNLVSKRIRKRKRSETKAIEADVRALYREVRDALTGEKAIRPEEPLRDFHWYLWLDPTRPDVLAPDSDLDTQYKMNFRQFHRHRERGIRPDEVTEFKTLVEVARAMEYLNDPTDPTQYAPVQLESLDIKGSDSPDEPTPIGRRRIGAEEAADPEDKQVEISHKSCDHILTVALPRSGKDSTLASIGMNLWREHGYKYISILDDGRMETPMLAIPNDEDVIRQNLGRLGQQPQAMDATVWVPRMGNIPDKLPANFEVFTIGIDSLSPHLILRLAGVSSKDPTTPTRVKQALDTTLDRSGNVEELIALLQSYADEMEATIEWTEQVDTGDDEEVETREAHYSLEAEDALKKAAQRIAQLAGEGLLTSPDAETNIDMVEVVRNRDSAAVLCPNFLTQGQEPLKYTIMDLWLRLIYRARDQHPRLPRVALEIRELKNVAPSKLKDVAHKETIKPLRQTIFFLSTQGGSRRILMLGSTQKLNDVYKSVRSNMATKILLRLGEEEIDTLDRSYNFSDRQKEQLSGFDIGEGMIMTGGDAYWPIELRGAPCGLGLGDQHWLDRYGRAWGARVRSFSHEPWYPGEDRPEYWIDLTDHEIITSNVAPDVGRWYLLPEDLPAPTRDGEGDAEGGDTNPIPPGAMTERLIGWALRQRREYSLPTDLSMQPTGSASRQKTLSLRKAEGPNDGLQDIVDEFQVPDAVRPWLTKKEGTRQKLIRAIYALEAETYSLQKEWAKEVDGWTREALSYHLNQDESLKHLVEKGETGAYTLTPVGKQTADLDWDAIEERLAEVVG